MGAGSVAALLLCLVGFGWPAASDLFRLFSQNSRYTHGFLVIGFSAAVIWRVLRQERFAAIDPSWAGIPPVLAGTGAVILGRWYLIAMGQGGTGTEFLSMLGFIAVVAGVMISLWGVRGCRRFIFPVGFLLLAVPLPVGWYDRVTLPLKGASSAAAEVLIRWVGIPVYREGNLLYLPTVILGVAEVCSGLQSVWAMAALSTGLAYWHRMGLFRGAGFITVGLAAAVGVNLVRLLTTAWVGYRIDPRFTEGAWHEMIGLMWFWAAVLAMIGLAGRLGKKSPAAQAPDRGQRGFGEGDAGGVVPKTAGVCALLTVLFLGGAVAQVVIYRHYLRPVSMPVSETLPLASLPERIGDFRLVEQQDLPPSQAVVLRPTDRTVRMYTDGNGFQVRLMVLFWAPYGTGNRHLPSGPHDPTVCYPAAGWEEKAVVSAAQPVAGTDGTMAESLLFEKNRHQRLLAFWIRGSEPLLLADDYLGRIRALFRSWDQIHRHGPRFLVSVETELTRNPAQAQDALERFAGHLKRLLPVHGIVIGTVEG